MKNIFVLLIVFCSCRNGSSFIKNLVNDEVKRTWVHEASNKEGKYEPIGNYLVFNNNGTFKVYYSLENYKKGLESPTTTLDGPPMQYMWRYQKDSTLTVGSHVFKVVKYNLDSIYLKVEGHNGSFLFTRYKEVR